MRSRAPLTQRGARPSSAPLTPPAPPQRAMRRVADIGTVTVAGQQLRVGRTYAGQTVAITMEDTVFRVLHRRRTHDPRPIVPAPPPPPASRLTLGAASLTQVAEVHRRPTRPARPVCPEQNRQRSPETTHGHALDMRSPAAIDRIDICNGTVPSQEPHKVE